jgi:hypothetical protein
MHYSSPQNTPADANLPKKPNQTARCSDVNPAALRSKPPPNCMDLTLFFPVGLSARHKLHGRGVVQIPPDSDSKFIKKMLVWVEIY